MSDQRFDLKTLPLRGVQLIEASAGTGKTFSLAGLYLRLIIERNLAVREILVVTFTRAAAKELRERIRQRLAAAAQRAGQDVPAEPETPEDELADGLIAQAPDNRNSVARRLTEAARRVDEATITTIHGFAQTAAKENAFDSALPFDRGEQVDDHGVYEEVVADYWRAHAIGPPAVPGFSEWWPSPDELARELKPLQTRPHAVLAGPDNAEIEQLAAQAREAWVQGGDAFLEELHTCWENALLKQGNLKQAINELGDIDTACELLEQRMAAEQTIPALPVWAAHLIDAEAEFNKQKKGALARGEALFEHPVARKLSRLQPLTRLAALRSAHEWTEAAAAERKRERRQFSFDDLISALHEAVSDTDHGERLGASLHQMWPWALVDEFQDTDPRQYAVFRHIYSGRDTGGLILIGDPKQSIYGFRGGDVHAYLSAAGDAGEQRHNLQWNFRSTQGLLDAVAALFEIPGDDAFLVDGIRFQPVQSGRGDQRSLSLGGDPVAPMTLWSMALEDSRKPAAERACRDACVSRIRALLDPESGGIQHGYDPVSGEREDKQLKPADIAVLVNTNQQAADIQRALGRIGIAAVCLHQASVFGSDEANDVLHVLKAAAAPADKAVLRGALPGPLLGYRLGDLLALDEHTGRWRCLVDQFQAAHQRWLNNGVLAALQPLIQAAAERLLTYDDGERRISNYLQLAELLASAEGETFGITGLLRWLRQAIRDAGQGEDGESEQLRLESDAALVRIATVHKAKGLEYPVVFLPFAPWIGARGYPDKPPLAFHDNDHNAAIDIIGEPANRDAAVRETRAEGLRLLYVALTRAELACFLPWGAANGTQNSALASLLHREDGIDPSFWGKSGARPLDHKIVSNRLNALDAESIHQEPLPDPTADISRLPLSPAPDGTARNPPSRFWQPWAIHSFTRLVHAAAPGPATAGAEDEDTPAADTETPPRNLPELPAGPAFGSAVHSLLETAEPGDWPAPGEPPSKQQHEQVARVLRQHGIVARAERGPLIQGTTELIGNALHTPLPEIGPLSALPASSRLPEMAFMLRLQGTTLPRLLELLNAAGYAGDLRRDVGSLLHGMMHGFIDLVIERDNRYFVIDYKTNWLGNHTDDYQPGALTTVVQQHHYDLQYLIYVTALHRYLRQRLPDYDPARHLGGVRYLFLRGMAPDAGERGVYRHRPDPALIERLDALLDNQEAAA